MTLARARLLLKRPGAWIEAAPTGPAPPAAAAYVLRLGPDRRARPSLTLDEAAFLALVETPGLRVRPEGGWAARLASNGLAAPSPAPGRPGVIPGEKTLMAPDGAFVSRPANLGESPIAWLARRKDASGRPWLLPAEIVAGERLRMEAERAASGPSVTMRWDALPRAGGGSSVRAEPSDGAIAASARVEAALVAVGPRLRPILDHICLRGSSLQLAEHDLLLRRRQGKTVLKQALSALADHYGLG